MTLDMGKIISQLCILFIIMAVGFAANKAKVLTPEITKGLSSLIIHFTVPAMLIGSVAEMQSDRGFCEVVWLLVIAFITFAVLIGFGFLMPYILHVPPSNAAAYRYMTVFSNSAFMGFPVIEATFGKEALFYAMLFQVPFNLLNYSLGIWLIAGKDVKLSAKKLLLNPAALSAVAALILYLTNVSFPSTIGGALSSIGSITTPASMLVIGATLGQMPPKKVLRPWRLYPFTVLTGLLIPFVLFCFLRLFVTDTLMLYVSTAIAAMPAASSSVILSHQYEGDTETTSSGVFITTLLSILTYPLLLQCVQWVFGSGK